MPRYPGYRFASEFLRDGRPVDNNLEPAFLRILKDGAGRLRAGLSPTPEPRPEDHDANGPTLTTEADAIGAEARHPSNQTLQQEQLLITAYLQLDHDRSRPLHVYVPDTLRPWAVRFNLEHQPVLLHVSAATETGARFAAAEKSRLLIQSEAGASFTRME